MCDNSGDLYLVARTRKLHAVSIPRMYVYVRTYMRTYMCVCVCVHTLAKGYKDP